MSLKIESIMCLLSDEKGERTVTATQTAYGWLACTAYSNQVVTVIVRIRNVGSSPIQPFMDVNGNVNWAEFSLAPGDYMDWVGGTLVYPQPGDYTFVIRVGDWQTKQIHDEKTLKVTVLQYVPPVGPKVSEVKILSVSKTTVSVGEPVDLSVGVFLDRKVQPDEYVDVEILLEVNGEIRDRRQYNVYPGTNDTYCVFMLTFDAPGTYMVRAGARVVYYEKRSEVQPV